MRLRHVGNPSRLLVPNFFSSLDQEGAAKPLRSSVRPAKGRFVAHTHQSTRNSVHRVDSDFIESGREI